VTESRILRHGTDLRTLTGDGDNNAIAGPCHRLTTIGGNSTILICVKAARIELNVLFLA
jgi:hypothetical protein